MREQHVGTVAPDRPVQAPQLADTPVHALRKKALHAVRDQFGLERNEIVVWGVSAVMPTVSPLRC